MEAALSADDIVREIFTHLRPCLDLPIYDDSDIPELPTLYDAALVCRRFSHHALNGLWRVMNDPSPLIALIPQKNLTRTENLVSLKFPLHKEDLSAFERYACRIQSYDYNPPYITAPLMRHLLQVLGRLHLLPNLRQFYNFHAYDDALYPFMSPTLTRLKNAPLEARKVPELLSSLAITAPRLHSLQLMHTAVEEVDIHLLGQFSGLQELLTTNKIVINSDFLEQMPFAPKLVRLHADSITFSPRLSHPPCQFTALRKLTIRDPEGIQDVTALLASEMLPCLTELSFNIRIHDNTRPYAPADDESWVAFFTIVAKREPRLQHLRIGYQKLLGDLWVINPTANDVGLHLAEILRLFPKPYEDLTFLTIEPYIFKTFPEDSFQAFSATFPNLKHLSVGLLAPAFLSFQSLATLTSGLPQLESLKINIDGTNMTEDIFDMPAANNNLSTFDLGNSTMDDACEFAACLHTLFPFVRAQCASVSRDHAMLRYIKPETKELAEEVDEELDTFREFKALSRLLSHIQSRMFHTR